LKKSFPLSLLNTLACLSIGASVFLAEDVILANRTIPSGCPGDNTIGYVLPGRTAITGKQGRWADRTAMQIQARPSPTGIPIMKKKESRIHPTTNRREAGAACV